jgi:hypothetical protein
MEWKVEDGAEWKWALDNDGCMVVVPNKSVDNRKSGRMNLTTVTSQPTMSENAGYDKVSPSIVAIQVPCQKYPEHLAF